MFEATTQKIGYWKNQLQNMGRRNRLLFFKDTKTSSIIVNEPGLSEIYETIVDHGKPLFAPLPLDKKSSTLFEDQNENLSDQQIAELEDKYERETDELLSNKSFRLLNLALGNLRYRARTIREERGFNALYLAFGFLKWQESDSAGFDEAPLVLVPIDIEREDRGARLRISFLEEDIVTNPTLQTKLNNELGIQLQDVSNELTLDGLKDFLLQTHNRISKLEGWQVIQKTAIGIFDFQTLLIIKDLEANANIFQQHPIIQMLSGALENLTATDENIPTVNELDKVVNPLETYQILDADSSQQEAIEAAKRGLSFVLQGPPGTGKSQTIANIIAESLADGKKVLFVSQKQVALDVVHNRLSAKGLGDFCLEVHSYKKNKKDVIADLGRSLISPKRSAITNSQLERQDLIRVREELNDYVKELHRPRYELGLSLYKVLGELANHEESPKVKFSIDEIENYSLEDRHQQLAMLSELTSYGNQILAISDHPWKGFSKDNITITLREEIEEALDNLDKSILDLSTNIKAFAEHLRLPEPQKLDELIDYVIILQVFNEKIFSEEYDAVVQRFLSKYQDISKFLRPGYWRDRKSLREIQWVENAAIDGSVLRDIIHRTSKIKESVSVEANVVERVSDIELEDVQSWAKTKVEIKEKHEFLTSLFFPENIPGFVNKLYELPLETLLDRIGIQRQQTPRIQEWIDVNDVLEKANSNRLTQFVDAAVEDRVNPSSWQNAYLRRLYTLLADSIAQSTPVLSRFKSNTHDELIQKFRDLDTQIIEASSMEIRSKLLSLQPQDTWVKADSAETTILKKELNKKRRIKPLRRLFQEIPNLILTLRPCLMMSPLTVSQLLDPDIYQFDITIFDEASQIPPEYAVGAIVRGKQIVVAGDRHQLPPTTFFQSFESGGDDENYEIEDYESILNACDAISLPNKMLRWHYRSEDEALIAFSNFHFYDNQLLTFPTSNGDDPNTGLEFIHVPDGIYRRSKGKRDNPVEAHRVTEILLEHLKNHPDLSVGIVTFSQSQRKMVEDQIEIVKSQNPTLYSLFDYNKEEQIFVKNLETVQGDERDVIIFSIGYGKDEEGKFLMNFGPLNKQQGERRLNVAVTRARKAVKLVSSIQPEDIDLTRTKSEGARLLRSYMKTARDGADALFEDLQVDYLAEFDSPFEEAVFNALSARGIKLVKQVGVSNYRIDFGVQDPDNPGRFLLGIECDGASYHSSPTARDRDRLRQQILENKFGWRLHRIWSRNWINDKATETQKVLDAIEKSKQLGPKYVKKNVIQVKKPIYDKPKGGQEKTPETLIPKNAEVYKHTSFQKTRLRGAEDFYNLPVHRIAGGIINLVEKEGPLHREVAIKRLAQALNVRLGNKIKARMNAAIYNAEYSKKIRIEGDFLWPSFMTEVPLRIHKNGTETRGITEIVPQEIEKAIIACIENSISIEESDVLKEIARIFGLKATEKVKREVQKYLNKLLMNGDLKRKGNRIFLSD